MVDTGRFQHHQVYDVDFLKSKGFDCVTKERHSIISKNSNGTVTARRLYLNAVFDGVPFGFTYFPVNPGYASSMLLIQTSLIRALYGHNATILRSVSDLDRAATRINDLLKKFVPWLAVPDVADLVIGRIDYCYDHDVGGNVQEYLNILRLQAIPHRKTYPFVERDLPNKAIFQGVEYRSDRGHHKESFYDKGLESDNLLAIGHLRQEKKIEGPRDIQQSLHIVDPPTLRHITVDRVTEILERDLGRLGLTGSQFTEKNLAYRILMAAYEPSYVLKLIGYLECRQTMSREDMIAEGHNLRTMQRYENALSVAGVSSAMYGEYSSIPPLCIRF